MAKPGDWGGGGAAVPRVVNRERNVTKSTVTEPEAEAAPGEAPPLKYYADPWYDRQPFNPDFKNLNAKAKGKVRDGR